MKKLDANILTINAGSSSLKFALFRASEPLSRVLAGKFDRIGLPNTQVSVTTVGSDKEEKRELSVSNHAACVPELMKLLKAKLDGAAVKAIGHRVVHGGPKYTDAQRVTRKMIAYLDRISPFAPSHLPLAIALMKEFGKHAPDVPQVACFDTAFHRDLPRVAKLLPIPRRYEAKGVRRYGFHGLSYTYLLRELERVAGAKTAKGRVILAHLGNGASLAAVRGGKCIDTTMAFTPAAGLVMSTRSGDIDPGLFVYLTRAEGMSAEQLHEMVNAKSGLLGISETSSDVRDLLKREKRDVRAAEALAVFCYQARKWIGAMTAALGGLDTLVFSGGIGENSAVIRARICDGLDFLGIELEPARNNANSPIITKDGSKTSVRVIRTDEELLIARLARAVLESRRK